MTGAAALAGGAEALPSLRVVVVTYSPGETLPTFLASLRAAAAVQPQVVLADNGSVDGVPELCAAASDTVTLVATGGNLGYGAGANAGARGATEAWLLVANPDIVLHPGSLDTLLAAVARWPAAGAIGPAIITPTGALYPSARALPSLGRGVGHALAGWWWPTNPWTAGYRNELGRPQEGAVGWLSGSCLLLRRRAFESVGGFDPSYFMYMEDVDLCQRLADAGWASVYVPAAVVTHLGAHATAREPGRLARAHHRSVYRYLSRRYGGLRWAPLRAVLAAGLLARWLLSLGLRAVREGAQPTRSAAQVLAS